MGSAWLAPAVLASVPEPVERPAHALLMSVCQDFSFVKTQLMAHVPTCSSGRIQNSGEMLLNAAGPSTLKRPVAEQGSFQARAGVLRAETCSCLRAPDSGSPGLQIVKRRIVFDVAASTKAAGLPSPKRKICKADRMSWSGNSVRRVSAASTT